MTLTYTDIFRGAGGSSAGLRAAGLELRLAANHWARAIETHSANFVALGLRRPPPREARGPLPNLAGILELEAAARDAHGIAS